MIIRKLKETDLPIRINWMNNPKIYESMHFEIPVSIEKTKVWFNKNQHETNRVDMCFIENDLIVAFGGLTSYDTILKKAELYIFVNPELQSNGIGTKAVRLLCDYGFNTMGLNKIFLETNSDNVKAQKVYEKCGFILEGKLRSEHITKDGIYKDRFYYGKLKYEQ